MLDSGCENYRVYDDAYLDGPTLPPPPPGEAEVKRLHATDLGVSIARRELEARRLKELSKETKVRRKIIKRKLKKQRSEFDLLREELESLYVNSPSASEEHDTALVSDSEAA